MSSTGASPDIRQAPRSVTTADRLAEVRTGELRVDALDPTLVRDGLVPDSAGWQRQWRRLLPALAALLAIAGVICLVAANWQAIGHLARLGGGVAVVATVAVAALGVGLGRPEGRWLLMVAIGLIGPLLALYGQTYQTGADVYRLMFLWAALALPWMFASRLGAAWLLVLAIVELGSALWLFDHGHGAWLPLPVALPTWVGAGLVQVGVWAAWALAARRLDWLAARWPQQVIVGSLLALLTFVVGAAEVGVDLPAHGLALPLWFGAVVGIAVIALRAGRGAAVGSASAPGDLTMMGMLVVSITVVAGITTLVRVSSIFVTALVVILVAGIGAAVVRARQLGPAATVGLAPVGPATTPAATIPPATNPPATNPPATPPTTTTRPMTTRPAPPTPAEAATTEPARPGAPAVPWAVLVAACFGAWLGSALTFGFIVLTMDVTESLGSSAVMATILFVGAVVANRSGADDSALPSASTLFRQQFALAAALTAIALMAAAIARTSDSESAAAWSIVVMTAGGILINPEPMFRFVATVIGLLAASWLALPVLDPLSPVAPLLLIVIGLWLGQGVIARVGGDRLLAPVAAAATTLLLVGLPLARHWRGAHRDGVEVLGDTTPGPVASLAPTLNLLDLAIVPIAAAVVGAVVWRRRRYDRWPAPGAGKPTAVAIGAGLVILVAAGAVMLRQPAVGVCLVVWATAVASGHPRIATMAGVAIAWVLGIDYYETHTTLAFKGARLLEIAVACLVAALGIGRLATGPERPVPLATQGTPAAAPHTAARGRRPSPRWMTGLVVGGLAVVVGAVGQAVLGAEKVLRHGPELLLELAPRDPRAFLTGDYMIIDLALAREIGRSLGDGGAAPEAVPDAAPDTAPDDAPDDAGRGAGDGRPGRHRPVIEDGYVIVMREADGIGRWRRFSTRAADAGPGEFALRARFRGGSWQLGSGAYYFPEGEGARFEAARYGRYRLSPTGDLLLTGLLDDRRRPLPLAADSDARPADSTVDLPADPATAGSGR